MNAHFFFWTPLIAAGIHITEEFVFPGGFSSWYRRFRPSDPTITTRRLVIANATLLFFALCAGLLGPSRYGVQVWLIVMGSLFANFIFHAYATIRMRQYSPGLLTACSIYFPLSAGGTVWLVANHWVSPVMALALFGTGIAIMLYIDLRHFISRSFRRGDNADPTRAA